MLPIIYEISDQDVFKTLLRTNPGLLIIKFGATWCGPCRVIEEDVHNLFQIMPDNVQSVMVDIDNSLEFYSFMKKNRVLNGVPVILCYIKGNHSFVPNDYFVGASKEKLELFSLRCLKCAKSMRVDYKSNSVTLPIFQKPGATNSTEDADEFADF